MRTLLHWHFNSSNEEETGTHMPLFIPCFSLYHHKKSCCAFAIFKILPTVLSKVARYADFALRNCVIFFEKWLEACQHLNNICILACVFLSYNKDLKQIQVPKLAVKLSKLLNFRKMVTAT